MHGERTLDADTEARLEDLDPGGVILFRRNLDSVERLVALLGKVTSRLTGPRLIAIDQEGGRVSRLEPWIGPSPRASEIAARGPRVAFVVGRATGSALRGLGINLDFAPVVDLCEPEATNGIGDRSFGTDPVRAKTRTTSPRVGVNGSASTMKAPFAC